jgi:hypothetical protein
MNYLYSSSSTVCRRKASVPRPEPVPPPTQPPPIHPPSSFSCLLCAITQSSGPGTPQARPLPSVPYSIHWLPRLVYVIGVEHDRARRASPCDLLPVLRCVYQRNLQRESFALPPVAGVAEKAVAEQAYGVRQCRTSS